MVEDNEVGHEVIGEMMVVSAISLFLVACHPAPLGGPCALQGLLGHLWCTDP